MKDVIFFFYFCIIFNSSQFFTLISEIEKTFGVIDILINNAAIKNKNNIFQEDLSSWDSAMNVMLKAPFFLSQLVLKIMQKKNSGVIINIASISGRFVSLESPSYQIAKAGLIHMTRYFAKNAGNYGIRCNAIAPGFIVKDEHINMFLSQANKKYKKSCEKYHPMRNFGKSEDISKAVMFLCSNDANFINGETLYIDGGLTIQDPFIFSFE